jgi:hypothetical protein
VTIAKLRLRSGETYLVSDLRCDGRLVTFRGTQVVRDLAGERVLPERTRTVLSTAIRSIDWLDQPADAPLPELVATR